MTKVLIKLASGSTQERMLVTAFTNNNTKYFVFDGEATGSMGYPIVLVGKDNFGKIVGITEVDEWKNVKDSLKKIIAGEKIEYASVPNEINADDIYYRQLTLPIESFDILKQSYQAPASSEEENKVDNTPIFEPITPEEVMATTSPSADAPTVETEVPVEPTVPANTPEVQAPAASIFESPTIDNSAEVNLSDAIASIPDTPVGDDVTTSVDDNSNSKYEELKTKFLTKAEELFKEMYEEFNHND